MRAPYRPGYAALYYLAIGVLAFISICLYGRLGIAQYIGCGLAGWHMHKFVPRKGSNGTR